MWATFTSDLQEFASGAAEETNAVASKVGVNFSNDADAPAEGRRAGGGTATAPPAANQPGGVDGSVLLAKAALSMGDKGLKGLQGVTSMIRNTAVAAATTGNNNGSAASSFASSSGCQPSAALSSMLAQEDEEEEEEMGWDDDDDDLDVEEESKESSGVEVEAEDNKAVGPTEGLFEDQLGPPEGGESTNLASLPSPDNGVVTALQSKLEAVETARAELQIEYRSQSVLLCEMRAKVEDLEQRETESTVTADEGPSDEHRKEVRVLEEEVAQLKLQLSEQSSEGGLSQEHEKVVAGLVQEKATLEQALKNQRTHNEKILLLASPDTDSPSSDVQESLLREYQQQLSLSLHTAGSAEDCKQTEQLLLQMNDYHTLALKDAQASKVKLAAVEEELQTAKTELKEVQAKSVQAANDAIRLKEEAAKTQTQQQENEKKADTLKTSDAEFSRDKALSDSSGTGTGEGKSSNDSPVKVCEEDDLSGGWGGGEEEVSDGWGEEGGDSD